MEIGNVDDPSFEKRKLNEPFSSKEIHSSLSYSSIRVPPLVEYCSIHKYCETKYRIKQSSSLDPSTDSPSSSFADNICSISSPIVLKSPKCHSKKRTLSLEGPNPFRFYSVEELSLVNSLKQWTNTNVCPVGKVLFNYEVQECFLHSIMESGEYSVWLDTSSLKQIPVLQTHIQIFGVLRLIGSRPQIKANFYRTFHFGDLNLFVKSYKLMENYVPEYKPKSETKGVETKELSKSSFPQMNDTLDNFDLFHIL